MKKILNLFAFTMAVLVAGCSNSSASEIKSKEDLKAYFLNEFPNGHTLSAVYELGQEHGGKRIGNGCKTKKSVFSVELPLSLLLRNGLVKIKITKDDPWATAFEYKCMYEITGFADATNPKWKQFGVQIQAAEDFVDKVTIPLAKQDLLGLDDVDLTGRTSGSDITCDIVFTPWLRSYEPSRFAIRFAKDFKAHHRFKNIFSPEFETRYWCLEKKYDDTYTKKRWSKI